METLKSRGYKVEFYTDVEWDILQYVINNHKLPNLIYSGKVLDITEELAEKIVDISFYKSIMIKGRIYTCSGHSAKDNFITESHLPYCVITKE